MSSATDKARFYLESSVPELRDLERKKIFTQEELKSIVKKRSDFEHKLNSRGGSTPSDYARYAQYEMNLDALRLKRVRRMGIKNAGYGGQKRIFFILDRGVRKFYADMGLWMQYIDFARKQKSYKKLEQILTGVLRMHPTRPELWVYAARYAMDVNADMTAARAYMQRGLRFCKNSTSLWLEYAKLEMLYIAKIAMRRNILGLEDLSASDGAKGTSLDVLALPAITTEDVDPNLNEDAPDDETALQNLAATPVLSGAIPKAVFDAGMQQFPRDVEYAEQFFDIIFDFDRVPALQNILLHVLDHIRAVAPESVEALSCQAKYPLAGSRPSSSEFPALLGAALQQYKSASKQHPTLQNALAQRALPFLVLFLEQEDLDVALRKVILASLRQFSQAIDAASPDLGTGNAVAKLITRLCKIGQSRRAALLAGLASSLWPDNAQLRTMTQEVSS